LRVAQKEGDSYCLKGLEIAGIPQYPGKKEASILKAEKRARKCAMDTAWREIQHKLNAQNPDDMDDLSQQVGRIAFKCLKLERKLMKRDLPEAADVTDILNHINVLAIHLRESLQLRPASPGRAPGAVRRPR